MTTEALIPRLTSLDERVLAAVPEDGRAVRASNVAVLVYRRPTATDEQLREAREILHGLRRVGLLRCGRGGWWRRT